MSVFVQNPEEAATIASEFIYSVDNLPNEVTHLLQEIKHKDIRAQELQQEIEKDSAKYVRHSLRASSSTPSSPSGGPSPRSSLFPAKIAASYAEIEQLSTEKCILAQHLIDLVTRTRARLDADLTKVRILQGEVGEYPLGSGKMSAATPGADGHVVTGRNPAIQIGESLRNVVASASLSDVKQAPATPTSASASGSAGLNSNKKRRLNATSIKLTPATSPTKHRSASPTTSGTTTTHTHQRSRLSRQIHLREEPEVDPEVDDDADGEDGDAEDERLYCFCQKQSYGDMIACDNEGECPYEWFHLTCVGMKQPTPEKWYCSVCESKGAGTNVGRKGRKK